MSTIYTINNESNIVTVSATDQLPIYKSSTGRTMKASATQLRVYALGTTTSDPLGFYGATSVVQPAATNQAAPSNTVSTSTNAWGYSTSTQADAIRALVVQLRSDLVSLGLIKGSN